MYPALKVVLKAVAAATQTDTNTMALALRERAHPNTVSRDPLDDFEHAVRPDVLTVYYTGQAKGSERGQTPWVEDDWNITFANYFNDTTYAFMRATPSAMEQLIPKHFERRSPMLSAEEIRCIAKAIFLCGNDLIVLETATFMVLSLQNGPKKTEYLKHLQDYEKALRESLSRVVKTWGDLPPMLDQNRPVHRLFNYVLAKHPLARHKDVRSLLQTMDGISRGIRCIELDCHQTIYAGLVDDFKNESELIWENYERMCPREFPSLGLGGCTVMSRSKTRDLLRHLHDIAERNNPAMLMGALYYHASQASVDSTFSKVLTAWVNDKFFGVMPKMIITPGRYGRLFGGTAGRTWLDPNDVWGKFPEGFLESASHDIYQKSLPFTNQRTLRDRASGAHLTCCFSFTSLMQGRRNRYNRYVGEDQQEAGVRFLSRNSHKPQTAYIEMVGMDGKGSNTGATHISNSIDI